jgi:hypothetical protein
LVSALPSSEAFVVSCTDSQLTAISRGCGPDPEGPVSAVPVLGGGGEVPARQPETAVLCSSWTSRASCSDQHVVSIDSLLRAPGLAEETCAPRVGQTISVSASGGGRVRERSSVSGLKHRTSS